MQVSTHTVCLFSYMMCSQAKQFLKANHQKVQPLNYLFSSLLQKSKGHRGIWSGEKKAAISGIPAKINLSLERNLLTEFKKTGVFFLVYCSTSQRCRKPGLQTVAQQLTLQQNSSHTAAIISALPVGASLFSITKTQQLSFGYLAIPIN